MSIETGGPAFPHMGRCVAPDVYEMFAEGGMTLRDWFAGQALAGLLAMSSSAEFTAAQNKKMKRVGMETPDFLAFLSYSTADAMLKARGES